MQKLVNSKINILLIMITMLALGFFLVRQFYLQREVIKASEPETANAVALEVAELIKATDKMRKEVVSLKDEHNKLSEANVNQKIAETTLTDKIKEYEIIFGVTKVEGPGVMIMFDEKLDSTQVVDFINALKNIGVEAISINHKRFTPYSSIEQGQFLPPIKIEAIGKSDLLQESLSRKGGIIEQLGTGQVQSRDRLILPAIGV